MPEIFKFKIPQAYAVREKSGIKVTLFYRPEKDREYMTGRDLSDAAVVEFGINALQRLRSGGYAEIGTCEFPLRPASGAIVDYLRNGKIFSHRRDGGAKVHPWYHGIPSGFPSTKEHFRDIRMLQRKEGAEESILWTRDRNPWVYVPNDEVGKAVTLAKLRELEIDAPVAETEVDYWGGPDVLEIREGGSVISTFHGLIYLSWEQEKNLAIANARYWKYVDPENVCATDGETFMGKDGLVHLNREVFELLPSRLATMRSGDVMRNPVVYRLNRSTRRPELQTGEPEAPYIFKPDDGLRRALSSYGAAGNWKGRWLDHEIEEERKQLEKLKGGSK
ncbi:MAG: hypothetical protein HYU56_02465 [Candidatus Aenigmarchaeota archaeon]|nr:hypothetical protein [Candidatus Aenigmarchaeota archaeon]